MKENQSLPPSHREAIRELFLRRKPEYTTREAARLLGMGLGDFLSWISSGTLSVDWKRKKRQLGGPRHVLVSWQELASAALLRWTVLEIHDALGKEANSVMPSLLRPATIKSLRLPEYQVRLLESLAKREGVSMEEYIYNAMLDVEAACDPEEIEKLLPGFHEAMAFPE